MTTLDVNCDLGERLPGVDDRRLMPFVSSCSIACGGHAGDDESMRRTVRSALEHEVAIGAHPSYPDRDHFGRRSLKLGPRELEESIYRQCRVLAENAVAEGTSLAHVKPHGALYNDTVHDPAIAAAFLAAVRRLQSGLKIFGLAGTQVARLATAHGLPFVAEAFADRRYRTAHRLLPRSEPGSVLTDPEVVLEQVAMLLQKGQVETASMGVAPVQAQTLCVHSDTPGAVQLLAAIQDFLRQRGVSIRAPG